jgi:hypothetical protein
MTERRRKKEIKKKIGILSFALKLTQKQSCFRNQILQINAAWFCGMRSVRFIDQASHQSGESYVLGERG